MSPLLILLIEPGTTSIKSVLFILPNLYTRGDAEHIMKMELAQHFMNKGYYFQKVHLNNDTELMISNRQYNTEIQFQWVDIDENII